MIPDNVLLLIFFLLGLFCLFIFGFPVLLTRYYHHELDETLLATIEKGQRIVFILFMIAIIILGGIWNNIDIPTILRMWPLILIFLIPPSYLCYRQFYTLVNPLTDEQLEDPRVRDLDLSLPNDKAFRLCITTIDMLDATEYVDNITSDPDSGTISFEISPLYYLRTCLKWPTRITISLNETDSITTHVKIFGITPKGTVEYIPGRIPSGLNEGYVNRIAGYLQRKNPSKGNDKSPPGINA
jgi:hypothetical protein